MYAHNVWDKVICTHIFKVFLWYWWMLSCSFSLSFIILCMWSVIVSYSRPCCRCDDDACWFTSAWRDSFSADRWTQIACSNIIINIRITKFSQATIIVDIYLYLLFLFYLYFYYSVIITSFFISYEFCILL